MPEAPLDLDGLVKAIDPGHPSHTFGGRHEAGQDPHRGGFSGSVGAQKGQHLSLVHREGDPVDGREVTVAFGDVLDFNHRGFAPALLVDGPTALSSSSGPARNLTESCPRPSRPVGCMTGMVTTMGSRFWLLDKVLNIAIVLPLRGVGDGMVQGGSHSG